MIDIDDERRNQKRQQQEPDVSPHPALLNPSLLTKELAKTRLANSAQSFRAKKTLNATAILKVAQLRRDIVLLYLEFDAGKVNQVQVSLRVV